MGLLRNVKRRLKNLNVNMGCKMEILIIYLVGVMLSLITSHHHHKATTNGRDSVFDYLMYYLFIPSTSWVGFIICLLALLDLKCNSRY